MLRIGSHDISDPFFWMRDDSRKNPQVQALIEQENRFTEVYGKAFEPLQQQLLKELKAHVDHDVSRLPYPHGGYYYSTKRDKGQKYAIHIRGKELNDQQAIKDPQVRVVHTHTHTHTHTHSLLVCDTCIDDAHTVPARVIGGAGSQQRRRGVRQSQVHARASSNAFP